MAEGKVSASAIYLTVGSNRIDGVGEMPVIYWLCRAIVTGAESRHLGVI